MNPLDNPFAPGAGSPPPELAGRAELLGSIHVAAERTRRLLAARSVLLLGLRGVGKTVLLDRVHDQAQADGLATIMIEATERSPLPALLAAELHRVLLRLSRQQRVRDLGSRAMRVLAGFVSALNLKYGGIELGIDAPGEPGVADSGDLELDLAALFEAVGAAASASDTALIMLVDEFQYVPKVELAALISALHRAAQRRLPIFLAAAGLPQLRARVAEAKTYAERLFEFREIGPLDEGATTDAVAKPIRARDIDIVPDALRMIFSETQGYPYFLQEWGKHAWDVAERSPIDTGDIARASDEVSASLDAGFFRARFDRLTTAQKRYLRAMAELGPGPHRSGEIARNLDRKVTSLGPTRAQLIAKGMVWSAARGDTAFTVPLFDRFMRRIMPGPEWRE
ncbi:MAG: ATP-binding protein [Immundisolibacterales bacterium]|nr:ATP-binding protein [Immundisolibacterales bacterium]